MKTRPLPETDLARISAAPPHSRRRLLQGMALGRPPFSYEPFRKALHDLFNLQSELLGPHSTTNWSTVESLIARGCKTEQQSRANLEVARALHDFVGRRGVTARQFHIPSLALGVGLRVRYWLDAILLVNGRPLVPFIDPRRTRGLTREARRIVFSIMHQRLGAANPDFADVQLGIFQFTHGNVHGIGREAVLHIHDCVPLISADELESIIASTYFLWREVLEELEAGKRKQAASRSGTLI